MHFRIAARGAPEASRAPALERLIARAGRASSAAVWRTEAFRAIAADGADPPPIAVAQLRASGDVGRYGWVAVATPVHLVAGHEHRASCPPTAFSTSMPSEADRLAEDFNRSFGDGGARLARGLGERVALRVRRAARGGHDPAGGGAGRGCLGASAARRRVRRIAAARERDRDVAVRPPGECGAPCARGAGHQRSMALGRRCRRCSSAPRRGGLDRGRRCAVLGIPSALAIPAGGRFEPGRIRLREVGCPRKVGCRGSLPPGPGRRRGGRPSSAG